MGLFEELREFVPAYSAPRDRAIYEDDRFDVEFDEEEPDLGDVSGLKTVLD